MTLEVRPISPAEAAAFVAVGDPAEVSVEGLTELWQSGRSRPQWCFMALQDGRAVGRLVARSLSPANEVAPDELYLTALVVPWAGHWLEVGLPLVAGVRGAVEGLGPPVDVRFNVAYHDHIGQRRQLFEAAGFVLFQEKIGFAWRYEGPASVPSPGSRLRFSSLEEVGPERFAAALASGPEGTLDRNDRYYYRLTGPEGWAREMMGSLGDGDPGLWKLGYDEHSELVGYIMVSLFDEATATIGHIGVVPARRGRGYIDELLAETVRTAAAAGYRSMLSDVDVLNAPMIDAFERAGHSTTIRPWRVWHYRHERQAPHRARDRA